MTECKHSWVLALSCGFGHTVFLCRDCDEQVEPLDVWALAYVEEA